MNRLESHDTICVKTFDVQFTNNVQRTCLHKKKTLKFSSFNFKLSDCPDMLPLSISFIRCGYPLWDGNSKCDIPQFSVGLVWEKRNSVWKHCMNIWARPRWLVPRSPFSNYCSAGTPAIGTKKQKHTKTHTHTHTRTHTHKHTHTHAGTPVIDTQKPKQKYNTT